MASFLVCSLIFVELRLSNEVGQLMYSRLKQETYKAPVFLITDDDYTSFKKYVVLV